MAKVQIAKELGIRDSSYISEQLKKRNLAMKELMEQYT